MALEELSFKSVNGLMDGRMEDGQKVITIVHPEHSSGEQKINSVLKLNTCFSLDILPK